MMETFDVPQPDYEERCSNGPRDDPEILQTLGDPAAGLCHFWGFPECALVVSVSYADYRTHWLDREGCATWLASPPNASNRTKRQSPGVA